MTFLEQSHFDNTIFPAFQKKQGFEIIVNKPNELESAIGSVTNQKLYDNKGIFELSSAYIKKIALNHPFVDGNKRIALHAGLFFLKINGIDIVENKEGDLSQLLFDLIDKKNEDNLIKYLNNNAKKI